MNTKSARVLENNKYYRWQPDNQIVIERNAEQKKIFEEYFVIKNEIHKKKVLLALGLFILLSSVILFVIGYLVDNPKLFIIGASTVGLGIIFIVLYNKKIKVEPKTIMSDTEYEQLVTNRIEIMNIPQLGLRKLGLDADQVRDIKPIILRDKIITDTSLKVYNPQDKSMHSSTQYVIILFFTEDQLLIYKIQFDMCCNMQIEWTSEFFYKDICDFSSQEQRNVLNIGQDRIEYSCITYNIVSSNSQIGFTLDGDVSKNTSIQAMKRKIREKKAR